VHKCWSLYNKREELRIDDLRVDQVRTILLAIPYRNMGDWFACKEGDLRWSCITEVPEFYEDTRELKGKPEEPLMAVTPPTATQSQIRAVERRPLFEEGPSDEFSTLKLDLGRVSERRSARRYVRNLEFVLIGKSKGKFKCETHDISMSGFSLKSTLPPGLDKNIRGELVLHGEKVNVTCLRIADRQLKLVEADSWDIIRKWIVNW
jgi:hypothetical protein